MRPREARRVRDGKGQVKGQVRDENVTGRDGELDNFNEIYRFSNKKAKI